jgi:predicted DNA-binding protein YlxM (UPF0122 family)
MIGIYKISFDSGDFYIGQTTSYDRRKQHHLSSKGLGSPRLSKAFQIQPDPKFEILKECSIEELDLLEAKFIKELQPTLNMLPSGSDIRGLNHPRSKYSKQQLEKVMAFFLFSDRRYSEIAEETGVAISTVHDVVKGRSHIWLINSIDKEVLEEAINRRNIFKVYDIHNNCYEVNCINKFEKEHNIPKGTLSKATHTSKGWSLSPKRIVILTTPDGESFRCTESEARAMTDDLSNYTKNMLFTKNRESKGFSLKYETE